MVRECQSDGAEGKNRGKNHLEHARKRKHEPTPYTNKEHSRYVEEERDERV